ncbi:MAG: ABC transporter permease [Anaerolineae bacterium]
MTDSNALDRELSLTPQQQSDIAAASEEVYASAADEVVEEELRSLGRDFLALVSIFLIVAAYHIQSPLLLFESQFGRSFRNPSLQVALSIGLIVSVVAMIGWSRAAIRERLRHPLQAIAMGVLVIFVVVMFAANALDWNPITALFGIEPALMLAEVDDPALAAQLQTPLIIATLLEIAAIASVIILWQPWTRLRIYRREARKQFAVIVIGIVILLIWEGAIFVFNVQQFLLPRPTVILGTFLDTYPRLIASAWVTFQNALWGYVIGCTAGILFGMLAARFISFSRALLPVAIGLNAIPIIALAPIFNNWFGALSSTSKIAIVVVLTFFPAMISTVRGLTSVEPLQLELMRSYAAGSTNIFRKLRIPMALPYIFSALKLATTLSMIGAIVSEYFGGSTAGLGFRIRDDAGLFKYPEAWAAILMASLGGILFYLLVSAVERAMLSWHVSFREK